MSWREEKRFLLAYAGIMGPQDGVNHALEALRHLARRRDDWLAVFAGEGDVLPEMRELARTLGLEHVVRFPGWLDRASLSSLLASADVCIAPDPSNPLNDRSTMVKVMDYMAHARAIASYDLPETRHSAGDAALYARPNEPTALAAIIDELLSDADRRTSLGKLGRARVEAELAWEHSERHLLAAYERAYRVADARRSKSLGERSRPFARRRRSRKKRRQPQLEHEDGQEQLVSTASVRSGATRGEQCHFGRVQKFPVPGAVVEQVRRSRVLGLRREPAGDSGIEESELALVDDPIGDESTRRALEEVLRRCAPHFQVRRNPCAVLDHCVIEEGHADLERVAIDTRSK